MEKIILKVSGMSCDHCKKTVTRTISGFSGISDVDVNLKKGTASFMCDFSSDLLEKIKAAIADEGFEAAA
jgi:copper chaperone CopZ